ncbi:MAG: class I SAM-dependent methyltransferase [Flavobacteriaceae bacterium]
MEEYFEGSKIYGDDFDFEQIENWYKEEEEGYSSLNSRELELLNQGQYLYHNMNVHHGYKYLDKKKKFKNVLGIGSATGHEFLPIIDQVENLFILEPSDSLKGISIKGKKITYIKPEVSGRMLFEEGFFDLITCFGVIHHIPNVTDVLTEINRVLKPNGIFLFREPIISMGDWRNKRANLTKNERGIPHKLLLKKLETLNFEIVKKKYCFTMTSFFSKRTKGFLKKPIFSYRLYVIFDSIISNLLQNCVKYHTTNRYRRIFPQSLFLFLRKN